LIVTTVPIYGTTAMAGLELFYIRYGQGGERRENGMEKRGRGEDGMENKGETIQINW